MTVVFAALAVFFLVPQLTHGELPTVTERLWWAFGDGVFWLIIMLYMTNQRAGRALLTSEGIRFRTFFSRRFVRWQDITDIGTRIGYAPSGAWRDVRIRRSRGRRLIVPGTITNKSNDESFDQKLQIIQDYWSRAG